MSEQQIKLTQFSEGSGCGCKIAPAILEQILNGSNLYQKPDGKLLVGNHLKDDAAIYKLTEEIAVINTVDFFTPIVNDPYDFGRIAAANALSDIYAMGGKPIFANAILSWPVEKISHELAAKVLEGAKSICQEAGITLAGGHSIAAKDPIFGMSVVGQIHPDKIKRNNGANVGDIIYLTKPIGIGVLATALKKEKISDAAYEKLIQYTCQLNSIGEKLGDLTYINAMTDVTGFGLLGHLIEMTDGAGLSAEVISNDIPLIEGAQEYITNFIFPDNTYRNWNAYSAKTEGVGGTDFVKFNDPQTSGGLLLAVNNEDSNNFEKFMTDNNCDFYKLGKFISQEEKTVRVI
ncbi:MAG TPA: selenide, water dikinase SelD [Anditalea sp.]|nr:selenide, water dikinase SelD [Anditalea sp.]